MNDYASPPTPELKQMRVKHTQQSVAYNMSHFKDHFADTQKSIKKLGSVAPKLAKTHQAKVAGELSGMLNQANSKGLAGYLKAKKFGAGSIAKAAKQ